ncbi:MAG: hypothetical protein PWP52_1542 [Bacteroidales bacterium]|nr:hypothetical protein [Bacteroidales bacterium]
MNEIIITNPDMYFYTQQKSLEQRLEKVSLSGEEENSIVAEKTIKTIRDKVLGLFKIGDVINTLINWNDEIDKDIKEAKKEFLLTVYFNKQDHIEERLNSLKKLLTSPTGNTLFNKILRILDNSTPDLELTQHLAKALEHIAETNFSSLFEDHKYALNQIEMLTPQALTILSDSRNWPTWRMQSFSSNGGRITSEWLSDFVNLYSAKKNITENSMKVKISHSMNDLIKNRYIEALHFTSGPPGENQVNFAKVELTQIGQIVMKYIV